MSKSLETRMDKGFSRFMSVYVQLVQLKLVQLVPLVQAQFGTSQCLPPKTCVLK
jgi:hypothetical protein